MKWTYLQYPGYDQSEKNYRRQNLKAFISRKYGIDAYPLWCRTSHFVRFLISRRVYRFGGLRASKVKTDLDQAQYNTNAKKFEQHLTKGRNLLTLYKYAVDLGLLMLAYGSGQQLEWVAKKLDVLTHPQCQSSCHPYAVLFTHSSAPSNSLINVPQPTPPLPILLRSLIVWGNTGFCNRDTNHIQSYGSKPPIVPLHILPPWATPH